MNVTKMTARLTSNPMAMVFAALWVVSIGVEFGFMTKNPIDSIVTNYNGTVIATFATKIKEYSTILPVLCVCAMGLSFNPSMEMIFTVAAAAILTASTIDAHYKQNASAAVKYSAYVSGILFGYIFSNKSKDRIMFVLIMLAFVVLY